MQNVQILNSTGSVLSYGYSDMSANAGYNPAIHSVVQVGDDSYPPDGVPLKYVKVVDSAFVEMSAVEKAAVDAVTPIATPQRKIVMAETTVATGGTDAATGFATVIGGQVTAKPVKASDYQLLVTFELALVANATWGATGPDRAAQARLMWDGGEIAGWLNPLAFYTTCTAALGAALAEGHTPTIDLQIRRFGSAGSARARRIRLELAPTLSAAAI
jgi:hypothetical protein